MAYFSNGEEGDRFYMLWCSRCIHGEDPGEYMETSCPVWLSHILYAYELANKEDDPGKVILDMLIPMDGVFQGKCAMFRPGTKPEA